jgi:hypothetical protein
LSLRFFGSWLIYKMSRSPLPLLFVSEEVFRVSKLLFLASSPSGLRSYSDFLDL